MNEPQDEAPVAPAADTAPPSSAPGPNSQPVPLSVEPRRPAAEPRATASGAATGTDSSAAGAATGTNSSAAGAATGTDSSATGAATGTDSTAGGALSSSAPGGRSRRGSVTSPPPLRAAPFWPRLARDFRRLRQVKGRAFWPALVDAALLDSGFQALAAHRLAHTLLSWRIPLLPALCRRWAIGACGIDILPRAEIGGGCVIAHGLGLVIGGYTVIGEDCTLLQGVTLGEARFDELDYPRLGNRVTVSAGALVLGGVDVGDDALIAAGAVVVADVPAGATVAGVPARIVRTAGTPTARPTPPAIAAQERNRP